MRTIGFVSVGRSDYGILRPVLQEVSAQAMRPVVFAGGAHLVAAHGHTIDAIEHDGWEIVARVDMLLASDTPEGAATSVGVGVLGFASAFQRVRPDLLLIVGDRTEMLAAACAALPLGIPTAHLHGGEISRGAVDELARHAITKLSHLHFVATEAAGGRVLQMGEESWRVTVSGAPALDLVRGFTPMDRITLERRIGIPLRGTPLVVTFHPETLDFERTEAHATEVAAAIAEWNGPVVITSPNADAGRARVMSPLAALVDRRSGTVLVHSLGQEAYYSLLSCAGAMVGNSSSGIIEAPSFGLPVVNVGERQAGRDRAANVIDVPPARQAIADALRRAASPGFRQALSGAPNPYGDGHASVRIASRLASVEIGPSLLRKAFIEMPRVGVATS